jgi:hypothetical protein
MATTGHRAVSSPAESHYGWGRVLMGARGALLESQLRTVAQLSDAIEALARPLRERGVEVIVGVAMSRPLDPGAAACVHRAAQDILAHIAPQPTTLVIVRLAGSGPGVTLTIGHDRLPVTAPHRTWTLTAGEPLGALGVALANRDGSLRRFCSCRFERFVVTLPVG